MKRPSLLALLVSVVLLASACAMGPRIPPNPANPIRTVAVLPIYNATNDVEGPEAVRALVEGHLRGLHYAVLPSAEADAVLRDRMGITLGSQLNLTTPRKLGEELGVDAVIYGYLLNFETVTTGVYNVKKVRAGFALIDAKSGRTIWSRGQGVKSELTSGGLIGKGVSLARDVQERREGLEPFKSIEGIERIPGITEWRKLERKSEASVGDAALFSLGERLVTKALGVHLKLESEAMADMIFRQFPVGPGVSAGPRPVMARVQPPVPRFGMNWAAVVDTGRRDYTADFVIKTMLREEGRTFTARGRFARLGASFRTDMDMSEAMRVEGNDMPEGFAKTVHITRKADTAGFTLYPDLKRYFEHEAVEGRAPKVAKERVGEEPVDGRICDKFRVTVTEGGKGARAGFIWEARELDRFVVRAEFEEEGARSVMEVRNVRFASPPAELFEIPPDYAKAASFMDLMEAR
jgi:hypothetical protein